MPKKPKKKDQDEFGLVALSVDALHQLQALVGHELHRRKVIQAREKVEDYLSSEGLTLWDLLTDTHVSVEGPPKGKLSKSAVQPSPKISRLLRGRGVYKHPSNPEITWRGSGRRPPWLNEWLAKGNRLEDLVFIPDSAH